MTKEVTIQVVAAKVLGVAIKDVVVKERLMGGMSNYTYVIEVKGKTYTFRLPGKNAEKFVDRRIEKENIELVESLHLNNKTIFLDVEAGYKIAEYIEGQPLSELDPLAYLEEAATVLHKIHDSGLKACNDYDKESRLEFYESHLNEFNYKHDERYHDLKKKWESKKSIYINKENLVLTHGDSQISNFLVTKTGLRLMDWEFTGNNDPFYDIACFGNNDFAHAEALLPVYLKREATKDDFNRLYFNRMYQCLQWHNVALYKDFIGLSKDLGVDFKFFADLYLDKATKFFDKIQ